MAFQRDSGVQAPKGSLQEVKLLWAHVAQYWHYTTDAVLLVQPLLIDT